MKITKAKLKQIIKEEVAGMDETTSPMDFSKGRDPAMSQTPDLAPAPVEEPEEGTSIDSLKDVFYKILNSPDGTLTLNKRDATMLAGLIAPYGE
tara:strand:- start:792 stop:1073 length:282 start_codon:yes stop_codon:yes gene_type:complete